MIAVYYDETNDIWKKADSENKNPKYKWYNYCDKMWANSVTVSSTNREAYLSADLGTEIPMNEILTMQVWIPRYKYTVWNYNSDGTVTSQPHEIQINFENETKTTGEIKCTDNIQGTSDGTLNGTNPTTSETCKLRTNNQTCTDNLCNGKTYTHPSFTFGEEELKGFWVGKFEASSDINCTPTTNSAIGEGCNLSTIRPLVKPNITNWRGFMISIFEHNIMAMNDSGNKYGFDITDDTHMIKNMEWGAVAYLSHSKYGIGTEIGLNSYDGYMTGCGPQAEGSEDTGSTCNAYNTPLGQSASTTGNIYGIYDMSGLSYEHVMGNIISPYGDIMMSGMRANTSYPNNHSGYSGVLYYNGTIEAGYGSFTGTYEYPNNKYYDKYSFNTSSTKRSKSKLGDAIKEVYNVYSTYGWYGDLSYLARNVYPWFARGGHLSEVSDAGIFNSSNTYGNAREGLSSRLAISQSN